MDNKEWHDERRKGLGGSDAAPACGLSPWKTPYQLWLEKTGQTEGPQQDNDAMFWGRTLEPVIRQRYADVTGRTVIIPNEIIRHPKIDWMLANLDGLAENRVVEIKTARSPIGWGEPGSNEIPEIYMLQVQHYLTVTKLSLADVAVLIGGSDFRLYEIEADHELQELLIEKEAAFWKMVQDMIPPDPITYQDAKLRWGKVSTSAKVQAGFNEVFAVKRLKELKDLIKEEEEMKAVIMKHMGEADTLVDGEDILATWKASKGVKRLDTKALKENAPEIYNEYLKEGEPSRRLLIK